MDAITSEKQPRIYQKTLDAINLVQAGLKPKEALKAVNYTNKISDRAVASFNKKFRKHSLAQPKLVKLAHNAITDCLSDAPIIQKRKDKQGNEIVEEIPPTWTNKIAAASMIYDRVEPIVRQNLNVNATISPVDLSKYTNPPDNCVINVTPVCVTSE